MPLFVLQVLLVAAAVADDIVVAVVGVVVGAVVGVVVVVPIAAPYWVKPVYPKPAVRLILKFLKTFFF